MKEKENINNRLLECVFVDKRCNFPFMQWEVLTYENVLHRLDRCIDIHITVEPHWTNGDLKLELVSPLGGLEYAAFEWIARSREKA